MTPKDPFLEGTFWDKFWRPLRSRALLFTPEFCCFLPVDQGSKLLGCPMFASYKETHRELK